MNHYYFGYGANTSLNSMAWRCPRAKSLGAAVLPGWRFRFAYHADVVKDSLHHTHGVLWSITDECLTSLDAFEGYPNYYTRTLLSVSQGDARVEAWVYVMQSGVTDGPPSQAYHDLLIEGYNDHGLNLSQIHDAISDLKEKKNE